MIYVIVVLVKNIRNVVESKCIYMTKNIVLAIIGLVLLIFFIIFSPVLDQTIAVLPYNSVTHMFYGEVAWWTQFVFATIPIITVLLVIACIIWLLWTKYTGKTNYDRVKRVVVIILLSLVIGPGLIGNGLKNHWGRPRPRQVIREGMIYQPVWRANFNKPANNSFVSGHATIGFFLGVPFLAFGFRRRGIIVGLTVGGFVGLVRILQGGHYLSDVIFAGVFVWLSAEFICFLVDRYWFRKGFN